MSPSEGLGRDALIYTLGGTLQLLGNIALLPVMTNVLNEEQFGLTVTLQLVAQLCVHISSAGLPGATTREYFVPTIGPDRARRLVATAIPMALIAGVLIAATSAVWVNIFDSMTFGSTVLITVLVALPRAFTASALGLLRATGQVQQFLQLSLANTIGAQLMGLLAAVLLSNSAHTYISGYLVGSIVSSIAAWIWCRRPSKWLKGPALTTVLKYALPTIPHAIATLVLQAGDRVVIERVSGLAEVGRYQVAYLLASLPVPALVSFNNAWSPRIAAAREAGTLLPDLQRTGSALVVAVPCLGAAGAIMAPAVIAFLLPATYAADDLRIVCSWVSTVSLLFAAYVIATQVLFAERRTVLQAVITTASAVVNISLNLKLIPDHGLKGAAIATSITYLLMAAAITAVAQRRQRYRLSPLSLALGVGVSAYAFSSILVPADGILARCLLAIIPVALCASPLRSIARSAPQNSVHPSTT